MKHISKDFEMFFTEILIKCFEVIAKILFFNISRKKSYFKYC